MSAPEAPLEAAPPAVGELSPVMQDYLKQICTAAEWDDVQITTSLLASLVAASPSTSSEMIRKLAALGMVNHRPYGAVELTDTGRTVALRMMRRHRLVETFLVAELGYTWDEVHDEAEVLEHAISDLMLSRIDDKLGHPTRDPHGDPIPAPDGSVRRPDARRLSLLEPGETGVISRISDEDPEMLRYFHDLSVTLDRRVTVLRRLPFGAGTSVELGPDGTTLDMGDLATQAIWVTAG
ncbi:MAG: metal-dependent transcriptional regulator [Nakamurella sp.]